MGDMAFEREARDMGAQLHRLAGSAPPPLFDPRTLQGRILSEAMADAALRAALFRLVDAVPALASDRALARHVHEYLEPPARRLGGRWKWLAALGSQPWMAPAVRRGVARLARQFVAEETPDGLGRALRGLARIPAAATLDAVGEAALGADECDAYQRRYLDLLDFLATAAPPGQPAAHLSIKFSALAAPFDPLDYAGVRRQVFARLEPVVARLRGLGGGLTVDMEQRDVKPLTLRLFRDWLDSEGSDGWHPGLALQAYLPETPDDLRQLLDWAGRRGHRFGVRLVKGAYWDTELALARQRGWPVPVFEDKSATDAQYEHLLGLLFEQAGTVYPAVATHNLRSLACALVLADRRGLGNRDFEIQMLYGMAEPLCQAVASQGANLRVYLPTGPLLPGIAYLIRRLVENTANTSTLRQTYGEGIDLDTALARPIPSAPIEPETGTGFQNTPLHNFGEESTQAHFAQALVRVRAQLGGRYPLDIAGVPPEGAAWQPSRNPAVPSEILGWAATASAEHARRAVENARRAFPAWRDTPVAARVNLCLRAAAVMERRRDELAAWQVLEAGKSWREADAEVAEAIDFLRYYAGEMAVLADWRATRCFPGETNHYRYEPRGVAVVIPPWNFPLAILAGMSAAALVAGNAVVLKPASPTPIIAHGFLRVLAEAGFPRGVCQLVPGAGADIGDVLVGHPEVQVVAFTGSRAVGLDILRKAHTPAPGQAHIKQVVLELGGKNAILVDEDADLDEAVREVLHSAFSYQGQKCSACSRLIAVGDIHDRLVERLAATLDSHRYGPPEDPAHDFGPLITADARDKALDYIALGQREGRLAYLGRVPETGFYCPPAIFTGIEPRHRLAREEIFGPVLAVMRVPDFAAGLRLALDSDYGLTGGVFSRLPGHIALARTEYRVGNLYINRRTTGARVGIQPFGGTRLSGTGVQAGGPDYLKQFLWTRSVSENTARHGFVPDTDLPPPVPVQGETAARTEPPHAQQPRP